MKVAVKVPASSANLGPGFDTLGLALGLYLECTLETSDSGLSIGISGPEAAGIATDSGNLVWRSFCSLAGPEAGENFSLHLANSIPLGRGLGSSAAAIVAGLALANEFRGLGLTRDALLTRATSIEGHPDNVAAAIFGGLTVSCQNERNEVCAVRLTPASPVEVILVVPEFQLSTADARSVLPVSYSRADAVYNVQRAGLLVAALASGRLDALREAMQDRIHQTQRAPLVPGLSEILSLRTVPGLLGVALSGAGPSVVAFSRPDHDPAPIVQAIMDCFRNKGVESRFRRLSIDTHGFVTEKLS